MRKRRWILLCAVLLLGVIGAWLWWVKPKTVDMASFAPADSLLYLEANRPLDVVDAILGTEAWKALNTMVGSSPRTIQTRWLREFFGWTGIGPVRSVILARAQIAAVVTDLRTAEEGDTLNIRPEGAFLIETHTAQRRIKPLFEETLKTLAEKTYGRPILRRVTVEGVEYSEWIAPEGSRQIVGTIVGSLVIVGTNEQVVQNCVAVSQGRRPGLKDDPELSQMRLKLATDRALTFGYVPPGKSARLLAVGLPLFLGRAPGDSEFQRLITNGAIKVFGSLGWTSQTYRTGIEDRYLITLQPSIVTRLKPTFVSPNITSQIGRLVPNDAYSVTSYRFASPVAAWQSLKTGVSAQVDALSSIVFSSLLKSALLSYGIDDPDTFLRTVDGEVLTLRFDENAERSMLIAHVHDRVTLRQLITRKMSLTPPGEATEHAEIFQDSEGEFAVSLTNELVVIGSPADVRRYGEPSGASTLMSADNLKRLSYFASSPTTACIVTYSNDGTRVRNFMSTIIAAKGAPVTTSEGIEEEIATLPYSVTETTMVDAGIERTTRSPLGQFSTLLPLLFPETPGLVEKGRPSS